MSVLVYFSFSQELQVINFKKTNQKTNYLFPLSNGKWNKYNQRNFYFELEVKQKCAVLIFLFKYWKDTGFLQILPEESKGIWGVE